MEVTQHFVIRQLKVGEVICGRAVYNLDDYHRKQQEFPTFNRTFQQAKYLHPSPGRLSIITKSTEAEIFSLDYKQFSTLPEILQTQIKQGTLLEREFDDCNISMIEKDNRQWEMVK